MINTTKCDLPLFLHQMCCNRWPENYVRFEKSYGYWIPDGTNSVRFYLTVWDMACMGPAGNCSEIIDLIIKSMNKLQTLLHSILKQNSFAIGIFTGHSSYS